MFLRFLIWLFGYIEKWQSKKAKVNFMIYDVTDWTTIITIYILPNILRSVGHQVMKFGQLIAYNVRKMSL